MRRGTIKGANRKDKAAPKHRTKLGLEYTLHRVQHLESLGYTQDRIAELVGVSQPMVSKYVAQLRERYRDAQQRDAEELTRQKWFQYDTIWREAFEAWERSKQSEDGEEQRNGDAVFLAKMMDAWKAQRELRGLDAPTKSDVRQAQVNVNVDATPADVAALSGRPPRSDVLAEAVERERAALPAHQPGKNGTNGKK